jgi:sulfide:quinone oxidoreductase
MTRVTVVGAGFGALTAIRKLRAADAGLQIDVIAPSPEFVFYPGTIWVPTGLRQPEDLVIPLHNFFARTRVNYHQAAVTGLQDGGRRVQTEQGEVVNDGLIIASGGRFLKKLPGIEHAITPCEGIPAVTAIRDRLAAMESGTLAFGFAGNPKEPSAMRGGPVFEFLFGIDQHLRTLGWRERFKLVFFSPAAKPGQRMGAKAVGFEADRVKTEGGEFAADLILFMPGMTGNQWFDNTDLPRSEGGLLKADRFCRVEGRDKVYVAGDSGSFPGPDWLPKQAHMADLQAEAAAANLLGEFAGRAPSHSYKVELMCIVDSRTKGMLVARNERRQLMLPATPLFHWAKRAFEWWYLRQYR